MNPLLDDAQREHIGMARGAVQEALAPVADTIEAEGRCPDEVLEALGSAALLGGDGEDRLLRLALTVEQAARKSAAAAAVVASRGVARQVAGDELVGAVAVVATGVTVRPAEGGFLVDGECGLVVGAAGAHTLLVLAAGDGAGLWRLAADAQGVEIDDADELLGLNGAGLATVRFSGARVDSGARLGDAAAAAAARDGLTIAQAAVAVGVARGALDAAVADVTARREAGDRADRSQAVQWMLADIATEAEAARVATWYAASQEAGAGQGEAAAMCGVLAAEAAVSATRRAVQVMGERGLLRASGVERLYRDAKVLEILGGSVEANLARVASYRLADLTRA